MLTAAIAIAAVGLAANVVLFLILVHMAGHISALQRADSARAAREAQPLEYRWEPCAPTTTYTTGDFQRAVTDTIRAAHRRGVRLT